MQYQRHLNIIAIAVAQDNMNNMQNLPATVEEVVHDTSFHITMLHRGEKRYFSISAPVRLCETTLSS